MNTMIIISHNNLRSATKYKHKTINNWLRTQTNRENVDLLQNHSFPLLDWERDCKIKFRNKQNNEKETKGLTWALKYFKNKNHISKA